MTYRTTLTRLAAPLAGLMLLVGANGVDAKGCLKGAALGGVAGHVAGHHAVLGAAAGCVVGHHLAKKKQREEQRHARSPAPQQP
jgi:outer membrane lipoprotein SlyB